MEATNVSPSKPIENEAFWQHHYELQKSSGLSRTDYCRQHDLNYDRFGYWINKWKHNHSDQLISVKLKPTRDPVEQSLLCTLDFKNGHYLKIHDEKALAIILEKYC